MSRTQIDPQWIPPTALKWFEESDQRRPFGNVKKSYERILDLHPLEPHVVEKIEQEAREYLKEKGCTLEECTRIYHES